MRPSPTPSQNRPLLLWDGDCGFCCRSVEWLRARDPGGRIETFPYQRVPSPPMTPQLYERCGRAVQLVQPDGSVLSAGRAVLAALRIIGWRRTAAVFSLPPFVWAVETGYWMVARNRSFFTRLLFRP